MKSVLISIQPKWVEKIVNGEKTIEVRLTTPKAPFKGYIYCTKAKPFLGFHIDYVDSTLKKVYTDHLFGSIPHFNGKVIGEFVCDKVIKTCGWRLRGDTQQCAKRTTDEEAFPKLACLTIDEIVKYAGSENREVCGLHISDLKIYDKPKELTEFHTPEVFRDCKKECDELEYYRCPIKDSRKVDKACGWCRTSKPITRAPQSWQYVEEL